MNQHRGSRHVQSHSYRVVICVFGNADGHEVLGSFLCFLAGQESLFDVEQAAGGFVDGACVILGEADLAARRGRLRMGDEGGS